MEVNRNLKKDSLKTVTYLISNLENNGFEPVIARNYENYPNFGHDLDLWQGSLQLWPVGHESWLSFNDVILKILNIKLVDIINNSIKTNNIYININY